MLPLLLLLLPSASNRRIHTCSFKNYGCSFRFVRHAMRLTSVQPLCHSHIVGQNWQRQQLIESHSQCEGCTPFDARLAFPCQYATLHCAPRIHTACDTRCFLCRTADIFFYTLRFRVNVVTKGGNSVRSVSSEEEGELSADGLVVMRLSVSTAAHSNSAPMPIHLLLPLLQPCSIDHPRTTQCSCVCASTLDLRCQHDCCWFCTRSCIQFS